MNIKTGLSIYNKQWLIERNAALNMLDMWDKVRSGEAKWSYRTKAEGETPSEYAIHQKFFAKAGVIMAPDSSWDMEDFKGFEGAKVAVIPVQGAIMKNDNCGSMGTATLKQLVVMASNTASVETIVLVVDSPGGTVAGTQGFADVIAASPKRTVAICDMMMCSAAYWIGSSCDEVYAGNDTDLIGCIGTMMSWYDDSKYLESKGIVLREYFATESKDKNVAFTEADAGNGKKLVEEMLDPMNDVFLAAVKKNRAGKLNMRENPLTGKTYVTAQALKAGLIDGVKSVDAVIEECLKNDGLTHTIYTMEIKTLAELKAAYPGLVAEAVSEGVATGTNKERERVKGWNAFAEIDPEGVTKAIAEGTEMTQATFGEMAKKLTAKTHVDNAKRDNQGAVQTGEGQAKTDEEVRKEAFLAKCKELTGIPDKK